jgi:hypothetical protein
MLQTALKPTVLHQYSTDIAQRRLQMTSSGSETLTGIVGQVWNRRRSKVLEKWSYINSLRKKLFRFQ